MDFFSSKKDEKPKEIVAVAKTGKFVDGLTMTLLAAAQDRKEDVTEHMSKALKDLGDKHPEMVLSACCHFLQSNTSLSTDHRVIVLNVMKIIIDDNRQSISKTLAVATINMAFFEMISSKEIVPNWQNAASAVMIAFASDYGPDVFKVLIKQLDPGVMPHFFIVKTLGDYAVANPLHFIPNCKEIFGRLVALMGMIKHDNMRWVFSAALGHFCEAIVQFLANADKETIAKSGVFATMYSGEVFSAYEMMLGQWVTKNESSLRLAIIQAIGFMSETMQRDLFEKELPKMINVILGMYSKEKNHLPITHGLGNVLSAAVLDQSRVLDPILQTLMMSIYKMIVASADVTGAQHPNVMKNFNELLRCFEIISRTFADHVVQFLLKSFESREEKVRIGTLHIIKHLVNSSDAYLADKKEMLVTGLKPLLSETNTKVRKAFAQVVITLASHDYLRLEGGHLLVEFIVRQCANTSEEEAAYQKSNSKGAPDSVSPLQLRSMCDNILNLLTTTIPDMEKVLWPFLLETIVPVQYTDALSSVTKSIAYIAAKKRETEAEDYMIDFDKQVNIPKPHAVISRLLVVLSYPEARPQLGENVLAFFKSMGPVLHPSVCDLWDDVVPKMVTYLKDKCGNPQLWVQSKWEDLVLKFLIKTIEEVNDDEWNIQLGEEMCNQFPLYVNHPNSKSMLFKCIGVVLQRSGKKSFVRDKLDYMFGVVDHNKVEDRTGCAIGFGYCASVHLDIVLDKLQNVGQNDMKKKSTGLFGLMSDKSDKDIELIKCTAVLCYGYAAAKADLNLIKSRIEVHIIKNIIPLFATARAPLIKEQLIRCVDLIGKTVHPSHLESEFVCPQRKEMLLGMVKFLSTEAKGEITPEVRTLAMQACCTLTVLDPPLPLEEETELIAKSLMVFTKLPASEQTTIDSLRDNFERILHSLFEKTTTTTILNRVLDHVFKYMTVKEEEVRKRAIKLFFAALENFYDACEPAEGEEPKKVEAEVSVLLKWVASVIPRCTDPSEEIRVCAIECIGKLLEIKGRVSEVSDQLVEKMAALSDRITAAETTAQFAVVHDLARSLSSDISEAELYPFVEIILSGLSDGEATSASGTCIVLNGLMRLRGGELGAHVSKIVALIYAAMKGIKNEQTMNGTLHSFKTLATHHLALVATEILNFELPHDEPVKKAIQTLAKDAKLGDQLMKHCVDLLNNSQPYSETKKSGRDFIKEGTKPTLHATVTLGEMFENTEMTETVKQFLPTLLATFLLRMGSTNGIETKNAFNRNPVEDASKAFENLLVLLEDEDVLPVLRAADTKKKLGDAEFFDAIIDVSRLVFKSYQDHVKEMVEFLTPYISHTFDTQRITVAAIFAAFISCCDGRVELLSSLVNAILVRLGDSDLKVKRLVLRGLGNVAACGETEVNRYATTILSALMHGMDDPKSETPEIILEALGGLAKVMETVSGSNVVAILVNICVKLRPYFEAENVEIRKASFVLFGNLYRFGDGPCKAVFYEQIHTNMVTLLVHLNEEDPAVKAATKKALAQLGPLLQSDEINDFFQQALQEDKNVQYGEFTHKMTKLIVAYFSRNIGVYLMDAINFYKSKWPAIRANAAMFTGFLLTNLPRESRKAINVDHVCGSLTALLKDDDAKVRSKVAEAMSLLHDY